MKNFTDLTEREVLAVAISSEEEDGLCLPKIPSGASFEVAKGM